jgi:hypothetical protein
MVGPSLVHVQMLLTRCNFRMLCQKYSLSSQPLIDSVLNALQIVRHPQFASIINILSRALSRFQYFKIGNPGKGCCFSHTAVLMQAHAVLKGASRASLATVLALGEM